MERRPYLIARQTSQSQQLFTAGYEHSAFNSSPISDRVCFIHSSQTSKVSEEIGKSSPVPSPTSHGNIPSSGSDNEESREQKTGFSKPGGGSAHSNRQYRQRSPSSGSGEERKTERHRDRNKKSHRDRERDRHRDREKDNKHGDRRSDKDRRKDRERDRGRDDDRSRGRGDTEREDRHRKRERSPKEKEKNAEREKRRNSNDDKRKDKHQAEEKERKKEPEKEETATSDVKDAETEETVGEGVKKEDNQERESEEKEDAEEKVNKFVKRSTDQTVSSARERYMARQMARSACKTYIEKEEN